MTYARKWERVKWRSCLRGLEEGAVSTGATLVDSIGSGVAEKKWSEGRRVTSRLVLYDGNPSSL